MNESSTLRSRFGLSDASIAGVSLTLAGFIGVMGIITAEVLYPDYSTRQDISDLGSTRPPEPLGPGGIERWVVYPLILWLPAFGGYLLADSADATATHE